MVSETPPAETAPPIPVVVVLYEPETLLLEQLIGALDQHGRRLYFFLNSAIGRNLMQRLQSVSNAVVISSENNVGLGAALNIVLDRAISDGFHYIMLLDQDSSPDAELPAALFCQMQRYTNHQPPLAAIGPLLVTPPQSTYKLIKYQWRNATEGTVYFLPASGSLIALDAWKRIGRFRADYFVDGIDVEWGFRAWSRGYSLIVAKQVTLDHRWGLPALNGNDQTPQFLRISSVRRYYHIRNAVDSLRLSHVPFWWKMKMLVTLAGQIGVLLLYQGSKRETRRSIVAAISSGIRGKLGPL